MHNLRSCLLIKKKCHNGPVPGQYWADATSIGPVLARYWPILACLWHASVWRFYLTCHDREIDGNPSKFAPRVNAISWMPCAIAIKSCVRNHLAASLNPVPNAIIDNDRHALNRFSHYCQMYYLCHYDECCNNPTSMYIYINDSLTVDVFNIVFFKHLLWEMAWRQIGAKSFVKPMLISWVKHMTKISHFQWRKYNWNYHLWMVENILQRGMT